MGERPLPIVKRPAVTRLVAIAILVAGVVRVLPLALGIAAVLDRRRSRSTCGPGQARRGPRPTSKLWSTPPTRTAKKSVCLGFCSWKITPRGSAQCSLLTKEMIRQRRDLFSGALTGIVCAGLGCMRPERIVAVKTTEDAGLDVARQSPFSPPTLVAGLLADNIDVHDPTLTQDELEIYFSSQTNGLFDIWTSTRTLANPTFASPTLVSELSSPGNDLDPDVSLDGLVLYFSSDRSGMGYRLYVSRRSARDQPWGAAQEMSGLGTSTLDMGPTVDPTGLMMVFASERDQVPLGLYAATRSDPLGAWQAVRALSEINSVRQDENPALFDDGLSLFWSSRGPSDGSTSDLFETARPTASLPFSANVTPADSLNSPTDWEGDPWLSQDGRHILFVSDRVTGVSRIYEAWR